MIRLLAYTTSDQSFQALVQFKNSLNLHGYIARESHSYGTACSFAMFFTKDIHHELTESVYGLRMLLKLGVAVDHPQGFNDALDFTKIAYLDFDGR